MTSLNAGNGPVPTSTNRLTSLAAGCFIRAHPAAPMKPGVAAELGVFDARSWRPGPERPSRGRRCGCLRGNGAPAAIMPPPNEHDVRVDRVHERDGPDGQVMGCLAHQALGDGIAGRGCGVGDRAAGELVRLDRSQ